MANVKLNPVFEQLSGKVGDLVFRRYRKSTVISRAPDFEGTEPTEAQQAHRERFRAAVSYGKTIMDDPEAKALYEEAAQAVERPLFSVIVADYLNEPTVEEIDLTGYAGAVGDEIIITAVDDIEVVSVDVVLTDEADAEIERGAATLDSSGHWLYVATVAVEPGTTVRVSAAAHDRPGGIGEAEEEKAL